MYEFATVAHFNELMSGVEMLQECGGN